MDFSIKELSPIQQEYFAYWQRQAGDRPAPARCDLDVLDVPTVMPHVAYFDVLDDPLDFRHRLLGTAVRKHFGQDYTGVTMREIEGRGPGSKIWSFLDEVRTGQKPVLREVPYVGPKKDFLALNNLILPTVDATGETDMIILVAHFMPR